MTKEWRTIEEFYRYEITESGLVRNKETGKLLKVQTVKAGYCMYYLRNGCDLKNHGRLVHRLVAQTFLFNPNQLPEVNHKDFDKSNNHISNLEWCSKEQNTQHNQKHRRYHAKYDRLEPNQAYRRAQDGSWRIVDLIT